MKFFHSLVFCLLFVLLVSCERGNSNRLLEEKVLELHDEVMPDLPAMKKQKRELMVIHLNSRDDSLMVRQVIQELTKADSMMWSWMYAYTPVAKLKDSLSADKIKLYLQQQLSVIEEVNSAIKSSQDQASTLLKKQQ